MSLTSKSPQDVAREALAAGTAAFTHHSHKFSPKVFTQPQLFACLVLKKFHKTDYRGIEGILKDHSDLREILGLARVPHYTTLRKGSQRLLAQKHFRVLLRSTLRRVMRRRKRVHRAAADSSGFACGHASRYYVKRRAKRQSRDEPPAQSTFYTVYAKLELVLDTSTHLVIGALTSRGPSPDVDRLVPLLLAVDPALKIRTLAADAGYDSDANHVFSRIACGICSLMPALHGRRGKGPPRGRWRRKMRALLATKTKRRRCGYTTRAQVETGFSMIKRRIGDAVAARRFETQCDELRLNVLTHNLMIALCVWVFYRASLTPFLIPFSSPTAEPL
jgi:transposase